MNVTRHKIGGRAKVMVVTPSQLHAVRYVQNDLFFRKLFDDPDMMKQVMETVGSVLYERLKKKYIFELKSGVIEEATPETYVEDI